MQPDEPNAHKRPSYTEQAIRSAGAPEADNQQQPRRIEPSVAHEPGFVTPTAPGHHKRVEHQSPAEDVDAKPAGAGNIVTGDQPPLFGAASHPNSHGPQHDDDTPASGGSSTTW